MFCVSHCCLITWLCLGYHRLLIEWHNINRKQVRNRKSISPHPIQKKAMEEQVVCPVSPWRHSKSAGGTSHVARRWKPFFTHARGVLYITCRFPNVHTVNRLICKSIHGTTARTVHPSSDSCRRTSLSTRSLGTAPTVRKEKHSAGLLRTSSSLCLPLPESKLTLEVLINCDDLPTNLLLLHNCTLTNAQMVCLLFRIFCFFHFLLLSRLVPRPLPIFLFYLCSFLFIFIWKVKKVKDFIFCRAKTGRCYVIRLWTNRRA